MNRRVLATFIATALLLLVAAPAFAQETKTVESTPEPAPPEFSGVLEATGVQVFIGGSKVAAARPDETTVVKVTLTNRGDKAATGVTAKLEAAGSGVRFIDATATFGDIASGESGTGEFSFVVSDSGCEKELGFGALASSSLGDSPVKFVVPASCPGPRLFLESVEYEGGDGDVIVEPGELLRVFLTLHNAGDDPATGVRAMLKINSGDVTVIDGSGAWPDIASGKSAKATQPFVIQISPTAKRSQGCGGVEVGGSVSSDGTVTSDMPAASDGGPTQVAPAPGTAEPGSTGSGSAPYPGTGTIEPDPSTGTTEPDPGTGTTEPEPEPTVKIEPAPERTGEPPPPEDAGVEYSATATVTAAGKTFEIPIETAVMCAFTEKGAPQTGAPADDGRDQAESKRVASRTNPASVASIVVVLLAAAVAAAASRIPRARLIRFMR